MNGVPCSVVGSNAAVIVLHPALRPHLHATYQSSLRPEAALSSHARSRFGFSSERRQDLRLLPAYLEVMESRRLRPEVVAVEARFGAPVHVRQRVDHVADQLAAFEGPARAALP